MSDIKRLESWIYQKSIPDYSDIAIWYQDISRFTDNAIYKDVIERRVNKYRLLPLHPIESKWNEIKQQMIEIYGLITSNETNVNPGAIAKKENKMSTATLVIIGAVAYLLLKK